MHSRVSWTGKERISRVISRIKEITSEKITDINSVEFKSGHDFASEINFSVSSNGTSQEREQAHKESKVAYKPHGNEKEVNPHVLHFSADAPCYMSDGKVSLKSRRKIFNWPRFAIRSFPK